MFYLLSYNKRDGNQVVHFMVRGPNVEFCDEIPTHNTVCVIFDFYEMKTISCSTKLCVN